MTLRAKIVIIGGVALALLIVAAYFVVRTISMASFAEIETRTTEDSISRALEAMRQEVDSVDTVARDLARRPSSSDALIGRGTAFGPGSMDATALVDWQVDYVLFLNPRGEVVEAVGPGGGGSESNVPRDVRALATGPDSVLWGGGGRAGAEGLVSLASGAVAFSARPVRPTGPGDSGLVVVLRKLDASHVAALGRTLRLRLEVFPGLSAALPGEVKSMRDWLYSKGAETSQSATSDNQMLGYGLVLGPGGVPAAVVRVTLSREVEQQGRIMVGYFLAGIIAVGLAIGGVGYVVLDRQVVSRVDRLSREVRAVEASSDAMQRIDLPGTDELSGLSDDINRMLAALDKAQWELNTAQTELESRVQERTGELGRANERLIAEIDDRRAAEESLAFAATHDHLTGLYNRARFEEELELQLAQCRRTGTGGAVLWLDLDHFKEINDSLGHAAGDAVLRAMAERLSQAIRGDSIVARLGGDEFAILVPYVDRARVGPVSVRVLNIIDGEPFLIEDHLLHVSASLGVVLYPDHGTTSLDLLARADLAMYVAKDEGRDRSCMYHDDGRWHEELRARLAWAERIQYALDNDAFEVWAQPIVGLADGGGTRFELLIRMREEDGSIVPPAKFLPVAERLGSIREIDRWMVGQAIDLLAEEKARGRDTRLDVNLSGRSFTDRKLLPLIEERLQATGVDPARLGIEITETAAILDLNKAREFIDRLRQIGCRFSLDDFGSGFSSFAYLRQLPIEALKIDGSFIKDIPRNTQDQHMVRAMVELARALGVSTVAEFVQDDETVAMLRSYGIDFAQGYHVSRPAPVREMLDSQFAL
jgi:diguanylate cyclase (GGDEF)-like protein